VLSNLHFQNIFNSSRSNNFTYILQIILIDIANIDHSSFSPSLSNSTWTPFFQKQKMILWLRFKTKDDAFVLVQKTKVDQFSSTQKTKYN
jgi:hypothetical protein